MRGDLKWQSYSFQVVQYRHFYRIDKMNLCLFNIEIMSARTRTGRLSSLAYKLILNSSFYIFLVDQALDLVREYDIY